MTAAAKQTKHVGCRVVVITSSSTASTMLVIESALQVVDQLIYSIHILLVFLVVGILHPEEQLLTWRLELQQVHSSSFTLWYVYHLSFLRKYDQILFNDVGFSVFPVKVQ